MKKHIVSILYLFLFSLMATSQPAMAMEAHEKQEATFGDLPIDVLRYEILPYLDDIKLCQLIRVSKKFKELVETYFENSNHIVIPNEFSYDIDRLPKLLTFIRSYEENHPPKKLKVKFKDAGGKTFDAQSLDEHMKKLSEIMNNDFTCGIVFLPDNILKDLSDRQI